MANPSTKAGFQVIAVQNANQVPIPDAGREYIFRNASDLKLYSRNSTGGILPLGGGNLIVTKFTPTISELDNCNLTPVDVLPAPGAGKAIQLMSVGWRYTPSTTDYNHNTLDFYSNGLGQFQAQMSGVVNNPFAVSSFILSITGAPDMLLANSPLTMVGDGPPNPGADGILDLYLSHIIVTL